MDLYILESKEYSGLVTTATLLHHTFSNSNAFCSTLYFPQCTLFYKHVSLNFLSCSFPQTLS
jgi:hypothetical protein